MSRRRHRRRPEPHVSESGIFVGFYQLCKKLGRIGSDRRRPSPSMVYKVLSGEKTSRTMLRNIFENCPRLLDHPKTTAMVWNTYWIWQRTGEISARYR